MGSNVTPFRIFMTVFRVMFDPKWSVSPNELLPGQSDQDVLKSEGLTREW